MTLNAVGSSLVSPASDNHYYHRMQKRDSGSDFPQKTSAVDARLISEYYSSKSISFEYTSKDGDTVGFSMQSVEYSKSILEVAGEGDGEDMQKIIDYLKNSYDQMRKEILKGFLKSVGADLPEEEQVEETGKSDMLQLPEYWNAENTSQRIVDFAVSFFSVFNGSGDEFLCNIKAAIEEGFKQARDLLGDLPDQISDLMDSTYNLTMEKIDGWAELQGIAVPVSGEEVVA